VGSQKKKNNTLYLGTFAMPQTASRRLGAAGTEMNRYEARKLAGGYAPGSPHRIERTALVFAAALEYRNCSMAGGGEQV